MLEFELTVKEKELQYLIIGVEGDADVIFDLVTESTYNHVLEWIDQNDHKAACEYLNSECQAGRTKSLYLNVEDMIENPFPNGIKAMIHINYFAEEVKCT